LGEQHLPGRGGTWIGGPGWIGVGLVDGRRGRRPLWSGSSRSRPGAPPAARTQCEFGEAGSVLAPTGRRHPCGAVMPSTWLAGAGGNRPGGERAGRYRPRSGAGGAVVDHGCLQRTSVIGLSEQAASERRHRRYVAGACPSPAWAASPPRESRELLARSHGRPRAGLREQHEYWSVQAVPCEPPATVVAVPSAGFPPRQTSA